MNGIFIRYIPSGVLRHDAGCKKSSIEINDVPMKPPCLKRVFMGCSRIFPLINRQLETQLESSIILPGILELARGFFHVALSENSALTCFFFFKSCSL